MNSIDRPEEVYRGVPERRRVEALRRIYSGKVYHVERNNDSFKETMAKLARKEITEKEFQNCYNPKLKDLTKERPEIIEGLF